MAHTVEAAETWTGAYVCTRPCSIDVPVELTTSFVSLLQDVTRACLARHHREYTWSNVYVLDGELHVTATAKRCRMLVNRYTHAFREALVAVSPFATVNMFDSWARLRCVWPYIAAAFVAMANRHVDSSNLVHFEAEGTHYAVQHAAELVYPSPAKRVGPLRAHRDMPIVVHQGNTVRYTHTHETHIVVTTVCGKTFCTNPCPQYACPYAADHGLVFTRMPAGRCTDATLEAFLDSCHSGLQRFKRSSTYKECVAGFYDVEGGVESSAHRDAV
jgi:hypothetical protein